RFRRSIENKPTILLAIEQQPIAGSCSSLLLQLGMQSVSGQMGNLHPSDSSRKAAVWESPARQCRVDLERRIQSRGDETVLPHTPATRTRNQRGTNPITIRTQASAIRDLRNKNRLGGMRRRIINLSMTQWLNDSITQ